MGNSFDRCRTPVTEEPEAFRYRTIFLSDAHLGSRGCQAELLLDFLKHNEAESYYLVGDIVDGWRLKSGWYWPQAAQRRGPEAPAQGPQGRAHRLCAWQS